MAVVEQYLHTLYKAEYGADVLVPRYWVVLDKLMGGGSILNAADYRHLETTYNIRAVVNLEQEHSDTEKGIERLLEIPLPDDGTDRPSAWFQDAYKFVRGKLDDPLYDRAVYVHCQMGGSRTPAMLYFLLRSIYGHTRETALEAINSNRPYGEHPVHLTYLASADTALEDMQKP